MAYLVLVRHGKSEWNAKGIWTGWRDIPLSDDGRIEAKKTAEALRDIKFDVAFCSTLIRARETLAIMLLDLNRQIPVTEDSALNERNYGDLTEKNKWQIKEKYGEEEFQKLRRGWDTPIPNGETLKDVYNRVVPFYKEHILPEIKKGENVLVSAHGNSLRALIKYLGNISDEEIEHVEIATGEAYMYQMDKNGDVVNKEIRATNPEKV